MTNEERRINDKAPITNDWSRAALDFVIFSIFELRHSQQMPKLRSLGLEVLRIVRIRLGADRHLLDHFQTVSLEPDNFLPVISQEPKLPHAEVEKNLRSESVVAEIGGIAKLRVCLHGVET